MWKICCTLRQTSLHHYDFSPATELHTPMHIGARMGSVDSVLFLLRHGADGSRVVVV